MTLTRELPSGDDTLHGTPTSADTTASATITAPRRLHRLLIALAVGLLSSAFLAGFIVQRRTPGVAVPSEFAVQWFCSRVLWTGGDPYLVAGPGRAFEWPAPVVYPATALAALGP